MFQGRKITLLPLPVTDRILPTQQNTTQQSLLIISKSQFQEELREPCPLFALVAVDTKPEQGVAIPTEFTPSSTSFKIFFRTTYLWDSRLSVIYNITLILYLMPPYRTTIIIEWVPKNMKS